MSRTLLWTMAGCLLMSSYVEFVRGADLRTTVGNRTVHRTVSHQEPLEDFVVEDLEPLAEPQFLEQSCDSCGQVSCQGCVSACERWVNFEYLLWWRDGGSYPPLVTTSPVGTPQADAGVLGEPTTGILFGDSRVGGEARPGGRVSLGAWLNECKHCAVELRYWNLGQEQTDFAANSSDFPILARPFTDAATGADMSTLLAFPNFTGPGSVSISTESDVLGGDFLFRWLSCRTLTTRIDWVAGYQFSRIDDAFQINSMATAINVPNIDAGTTFTSAEAFSTENVFNAGQIGLAVTHTQGCNWQLDLLGKVGFGNMRQTVTINGQTTIVTPPPDSTSNVIPGPLAGEANSGLHERDEFAVSLELGAKLHYALNDCLDLTFGYTYILWSDVVQAGDQIDPLLRDPPPALVFNSDSYWVHGLNFGAQWKF